MEDQKKIEAVLFAIGDKIEEAEIARLTKMDIALVKEALTKLKGEYASSGSTFILLNENTRWKLTVREDYMPIVQKIVPKTELSRPVLETLAVIAWKSPVLQSGIVDIRSSKAYDHIAELEEVGFITKQRYGRSFMLRLSQQFFEYFDIKGKEQIKEVFKDVKGIGQISNQDKTLQDFAASTDKAPVEESAVPPEQEKAADISIPEEQPKEALPEKQDDESALEAQKEKDVPK